MRTRLATTLTLVFFSATITQGQTPGTESKVLEVRALPESFPRFNGVTKIDTKVIRGSTRWGTDTEHPPVSAKKAIALATREIKRFDSTIEYDRTKNRWSFHSIELIPPRRHGNWYWVAKFNFDSIPESINRMAGIPEQVWVPVLMNGNVVELKLPEPSEDMDPDGVNEMEDAPSIRSNR